VIQTGKRLPVWLRLTNVPVSDEGRQALGEVLELELASACSIASRGRLLSVKPSCQCVALSEPGLGSPTNPKPLSVVKACRLINVEIGASELKWSEPVGCFDQLFNVQRLGKPIFGFPVAAGCRDPASRTCPRLGPKFLAPDVSVTAACVARRNGPQFLLVVKMLPNFVQSGLILAAELGRTYSVYRSRPAFRARPALFLSLSTRFHLGLGFVGNGLVTGESRNEREVLIATGFVGSFEARSSRNTFSAFALSFCRGVH